MRRVGTLGDLAREAAVITVSCPDYHHASWPGWYLAQQFGAATRLQRFMDRCRCAACGQRASDLKKGAHAPGMGDDPARRSPYQLPAAQAGPVFAIGAIAATLLAPLNPASGGSSGT